MFHGRVPMSESAFSRLRPAQRGFTLVELLVTVAVIAILSVLAAPSMRSTLASQNLNAAYRDLNQTFMKARSLALTLRQPVTVTLNSTAPDTATSLNWNPPNGVVLLQTTDTSFTYGNNGALTAPTTNTTLSLCSKLLGRTKQVNLTFSGSLIPMADGTASC